MKKTFIIPILGSLIGFWNCTTPKVTLSTVHPDSDKVIAFTVQRGGVEGTIDQTSLEIEGAAVATESGENLTYSGGPYAAYSNNRLNYSGIAKVGSTSKKTPGWVYVSNPKNVFTFPAPNGSNHGYPNSTSEQTGANLYRLDQPIVRNTAQDALMEYANSTRKSIFEVSNIADEMVAAIALYVDNHMQWRDDTTNREVFADNGWGSYSPGWDFPQPADLTLTISGNLNNASATDDYMGDCEDHAILRASLLRAVGFAPWAIWDVIDDPITHEYNVVLYEGAYRLMDYGRIQRWLDSSNHWTSHQSHYGWNEANGPRGANATTHNFLTNQTDNFPGGKQCPGNWSFNKYYTDTCR